MPNGTVKQFHTDRNYGFITGADGTQVFVAGDDLDGIHIKPGDRITYEVTESDKGNKAVQVEVVGEAMANNPVGRTLAAPPDWTTIEDRERARRRNRRRR